MNYNDVRSSIKTGDIILVRKSHGILGAMTKFFTHSPYTHSGIAVWKTDGLYMAELNGGLNHLIPLSQLKDIPFDVYACPAELDQTKIEIAISVWLREPIDYGYGAFVAIGLLEYLRIKIFVHWRKILVCSGYVVAILETAGWSEHSRVVSPQELSELLNLKFEVQP